MWMRQITLMGAYKSRTHGVRGHPLRPECDEPVPVRVEDIAGEDRSIRRLFNEDFRMRYEDT
jgi:hypothetical protein